MTLPFAELVGPSLLCVIAFDSIALKGERGAHTPLYLGIAGTKACVVDSKWRSTKIQHNSNAITRQQAQRKEVDLVGVSHKNFRPQLLYHHEQDHPNILRGAQAEF
jgi:hypothetical protein